jgi:hypothetical protein
MYGLYNIRVRRVPGKRLVDGLDSDCRVPLQPLAPTRFTPPACPEAGRVAYSPSSLPSRTFAAVRIGSRTGLNGGA